MNSMQYSDNICEAIDIIAKNVVKGLNFDQTILCTITDDSQAKKGEYLVTDGSSIYNAISNNHTYKAGTQVYVLVPKGDYSQQKIIVSEYSIEKEQDENNKGYIKPIDTIIPVEEIEIKFKDDNNKDIKELGLTANFAQALGQGSAIIPTINEDLNLNNLELDTQYTRLSVEASFKTGFDQDIISGDYGLVFFLSGELMNGAKVEKRQYLFNCDRFFGNPYRFDTEVSQSIVFDISDFKTLDKIEIQFQESGNFYVEGNQFLQYVLKEGEEKPKNLFVNNIKLILGFGIEEYQNNDLILTSKDSLEYNHFEEGKNLQLNWIRKRNNNTMFSINSLDDIEAANYKYLSKLKNKKYLSIYWYKHEGASGQGTQDPYTKDYFYSRVKCYNNTIYNDNIEEAENPFEFTFTTDINKAFERIKSAVAITGCLRKKILKTQFITTDEGLPEEVAVLKKKERPFYILESDWTETYELDYDYVYYDPLDEFDIEEFISEEKAWYYWDEKTNKYVPYTNKEIIDREIVKKAIAKEEIEWVRQYEQRELFMNTRNLSGEVEINRNLEYNETPSFIYLSDNEYAVRSEEKAYYVEITTTSKDKYYQLVGQNYSGASDIKAYDLKLVPITFLLSNPVTFENNFTKAIDLGNVNLIDKLELECLDEFKGKYFIYGEDNTIPASMANNTQRYIQATFNSINSKDAISGKVKIQWKIPANRTMIADPLPDTFYFGLIPGNEEEEGKEEEITGPIKWDLDSDFWISEEIELKGTESGTNEGVYSISIKIPYQIKSYYSPSLTNNTIQCIVSKPLTGKTPIENKSEYELRFGPAGMNGTNYVFMLNLGPAYERGEETENAEASSSLGVAKLGDSVLNVNGYLYQIKESQRRSFIKKTDTDTYILVEPSLYDGKNLLLDLNLEEISWSWYNSSNKYTTSQSTIDYFIDIEDKCYLKSTYDKVNNPYQAEDHCAILQADIVYNNIKLTAYLPIPMAFDDNISGAELADKIIYNSDGVNPTYYKNPSKIFIKEDNPENTEEEDNPENTEEDNIENTEEDNTENTEEDNTENKEISNVIYVNRVRLDNNDNNGQYPLFKSDSLCAITVPPIYYKNQEKDLISIALIDNTTTTSQILFIQPILIIQNRFGNAMLNEWDGNLIIDKENNRILSAQVAAGEKNSDNSFSGILMGAVGKNSLDDSTTKYGLYGYRYGALSFGFKEDGTAFIGNSGSGRIEFNGTESTITSSAWTAANKQGMHLDLDDGIAQFKNAGGFVVIDPTKNDGLFRISTIGGNILMNVGENNYYLQSTGYQSNSSGFRLNLTSNGFTLKQLLSAEADESEAGILLSSSNDTHFRISKNVKRMAKSINYIIKNISSNSEKYDFYVHERGTRLIVRKTSDGVESFYLSNDLDLINSELFKERVEIADPSKTNSWKYRLLGGLITEYEQLSALNFTKTSTGLAWSYNKNYDCYEYTNPDTGITTRFYAAEYSSGGVNTDTKWCNAGSANELNCLTHHCHSNTLFGAIGQDVFTNEEGKTVVNSLKLGGYKCVFDESKNVTSWLRRPVYLKDSSNEDICVNSWQIAIPYVKTNSSANQPLYVLAGSNIYKFFIPTDYILGNTLKAYANPLQTEAFYNKSYDKKVDGKYFTYQGMAVDSKYFYFPAMRTNGETDEYNCQIIDVRDRNTGKRINVSGGHVETDSNGDDWEFIKIDNVLPGYEVEDISLNESFMMLSFLNISDGQYLSKIYRIPYSSANGLPGKIDLREATAIFEVSQYPQQREIYNGLNKNDATAKVFKSKKFFTTRKTSQGFTFYYDSIIRDYVLVTAYVFKNTTENDKDQILVLNTFKEMKAISSRKTINLINIGASNFYLQSANYDSTNHTGTYFNLKTGQLITNTGTIGGWNIASNGLNKTSGEYTIGMQNTTDSEHVAFYVIKDLGKPTKEDIFYVKNNGEIKATTGDIGGWTIGSNILKYPSNATFGGARTVFLSPEGQDSTLSIGGCVNTDENGDPIKRKWVITVENKFGITNRGTLYATGANISGKITATSGTIGGCEIDASGNLQVKSANIGTISADKISGGTLDFSNITASNLDVTGHIDAGSLSINGSQITGIGSISGDKIESINADQISAGTIDVERLGIGRFGFQAITSGTSGGTHISSYLKFGIPNCYLVLGTDSGGGNMQLINTGSKTTIESGGGISITGPSGISLETVNGTATYNDSEILTSATATAVAIETNSDINKKHTISSISISYDSFYDLLNPVTYKYNDGTSDRLHTGFIAQDVENALSYTNISTQDFAGLVKEIKEDEEDDVIINYYLRYDEFIALNTWQIQKLKTRVSELENKILELEAKIQ